MRYLVTGGAGYIGSVVGATLLEAGHRVTVLDDVSTGHRDAVPDGAEFVEADVADAAAVAGVLAGGYDGVLHFAARSLVGESVTAPELYFGTNVCGTWQLLQCIVAAGVPRLVFSSTAAVYGEPAAVPIDEGAPTRPTNPYGGSKLAADLMIGAHAAAHGFAAVSLRYFNAAGAAGRHGERHATETHLIPLVLQVAAGRRSSVSVFGTDYPTGDGTAVRDYIHVRDLATAHVLALDAAEPGRHRIYNLGSGRGFSVREVLEVARAVTGHPVPAADAPRRAGDPAVLVAASERIRSDLGWHPSADLRAMVADAWEFERSRAAG